MPVRYQWGSSGALARQCADGAPADIFLSAHADWIHWLQEGGHLQGEPVPFAGNRLVCLVPKDHTFDSDPSDLASLIQALQPGDRLALGDTGVPLGDYARQALEHAQALEPARPFVVGLPDAHAVLRAVEQGQVQAALAYRSDAQASGARLLFEIPAESHAPIRYWACVLASSRHSGAAQSYLEFLLSDKGRSILASFALE